jgi:FAD/FMN-containing dehydrogenase
MTGSARTAPQARKTSRWSSCNVLLMVPSDMRLPLDQLRAALGPAGVIEGAAIGERAVGWSRLGAPFAILRPASTDEVAAVVRICARAGVALVAWGGKTGLVDGALADDAFALSLERMNRIESVDAMNGTLTVQAGCILQTACEAAEAQGLFFPLDLGARGSATIGGVISTNAGGNRVVRFGMMRDLVLGLEAVLADGTVISSLHPFIKNNTGYDLKQLFIGSEGTLGIVTRAVLRLRPRLTTQNVAFVAADSFTQVVQTLRALEARLGGQLSAFEVMWSDFYDLVTTSPAVGRLVLPRGHRYYILVEALGGNAAHDSGSFESALGGLLEQGSISDAVIAQSQSECEAIWALRDDASQVQRHGPIASYDVSLALSRIEEFETSLRAVLTRRWPTTTPVLFGHVGDGNIHVVVCGIDPSAEMRRALAGAVFGVLSEVGGSISAEHGIGLDKRPYLPLSRNPQELALMRLIKRTLDPQNILNPGKIFEPEPADALVNTGTALK